MTSDFRIVAAGDSAIVVEFEERIDPAVNARAIALAEAVQAARARRASATSCRPTARSRSTSIRCAPTSTRLIDVRRARGVGRPRRRRPRRARRSAFRSATAASSARTSRRLPRSRGLSEDEVVAPARRARPTACSCSGSCPASPTWASSTTRIAMPRRATPRVRVPAGSVGIAGVQTGIYPAETPGGWQLIGRTPLKPFDPVARRAVPVQGGRRGPVLSDRSPRVRRMAVVRRSVDGLAADAAARPRDQAGNADDGSGSRALGFSGARRAGGRTDGSVLAPARQRARRQRPRRGDARGHAARPGARVRGRAPGRGRRRGVRR